MNKTTLRDDRLVSRADLINEPDDKAAPAWADWKAQSSDGVWRWYEKKPSSIRGEPWVVSISGKERCRIEKATLGGMPKGHDWRRTLKPVMRVFEPEPGEQVPCNFRVSPEFRQRLKLFAAAHDMKMVDVFTSAVGEYMKKTKGARLDD